MLKGAMSLCGLAVQWLSADMEELFSLWEAFDRVNPSLVEWKRVSQTLIDSQTVQLIDDAKWDLHNMFKRNVVSRLSMIFNGLHKMSVMKICEGQFGDAALTCERIAGLDANALYPYCMMRRMPVGKSIRQYVENGFVSMNRATGLTDQ